MENIILFTITTIFFTIESYFRLFIWNKSKCKRQNKIDLALYIIPSLFPMIAFIMSGFSLTLFYVLYFIECFLQNKIVKVPKWDLTYSYKVRFVSYCGIHLTILGIVTLITPYILEDVLNMKIWTYLVTITSLLLFTLCKISSFYENYVKIKTELVISKENEKEFKNLNLFLILGIIYVFAQAIIFEMNNINFAYLMCTNIISLFYICCYIYSIAKILHIADNELSYSTLMENLDKSQEKIENLRKYAYYDRLTSAMSRVYIINEIERCIKKAMLFSLIYIDLNGLKKINDVQGHNAGDKYIKEFVDIIKEHLAKDDIIARFGGDEFIILMPNCTKETAHIRLIQIRDKIKKQTNKFSFAAGIADTTEEKTMDKLINLADCRMYENKKIQREV